MRESRRVVEAMVEKEMGCNVDEFAELVRENQDILDQMKVGRMLFVQREEL